MKIRVLALLVLASLGCAHPATVGSSAPNTEVYAIRYGTIRGFPVSALIGGADTSRRLDIAMTVWLIKRSDGHTVLVDAGFYRDKFVQRWKPVGYVKPSDAVRRVGLTPEEITDVIISHIHWDHADGADLFPNARIWLQREELTHHVSDAGKVLDRAVDSVDAAMFDGLRRAGRLRLIDGDDQEIMPGLRVYTGGKHTFASEYVSVKMPSSTIVLASDNAYLYENFDKHVPISQTLDAASNLRAQDRMLTIASDRRLIVPGHDPEVFVRFPLPGNGVARIQ
jgi:glyoxylase-like metal-dependent hydrolase (beta-lactamase superfamily II)